MVWHDKGSTEAIKEIIERFNVKTLVETGTGKGINSKFYSQYFEEVLTCTDNEKYYNIAKKSSWYLENVKYHNKQGVDFIKEFVDNYNKEKREDYVIFFLNNLDYDADLPDGKHKFKILRELEQLKNFEKAIIIIRGYDNNLGHLTYDKIPLDEELLWDYLININLDLEHYINELKSCRPVSKEEVIKQKIVGLEPDFETLKELDEIHQLPTSKYQGILYCLPEKAGITGLKPLN